MGWDVRVVCMCVVRTRDRYTDRSTLKQRLRDIVTEMGLGAADLRAKEAQEAAAGIASAAGDGEGGGLGPKSSSGGEIRKNDAASSRAAVSCSVGTGSLGTFALTGGPPAISQAALASLDGRQRLRVPHSLAA